jgi:hypothetical protein
MHDIRIGMAIGIVISAALVEYQRYRMRKGMDEIYTKHEQEAMEIFHKYKLK